MIYFIYIIMAFIATFIGSMTGMGGGVIMKPVMDLMGHYDAMVIGFLSSVTVFFMAIMSYYRQQKTDKPQNISMLKLIYLGLGSIVGGFFGQFIFASFSSMVKSDAIVKLVQNCILLTLIIIAFFYVVYQQKIKSICLKSVFSFIVTGFFLGALSSFLGIGGGPINVAVIMFLFGMDIKSAAFSAIVVILFSQISKISYIIVEELAMKTWFSAYDLAVLPFMVIAALVGSFIGSNLKKRLSSKIIALLFNILQVIIAAICVINIIILALN